MGMTREFNGLQLKHLLLKKHKVTVGAKIPERMLRDSVIDTFVNDLDRSTMVHLETYLASAEKTDSHSTKSVLETVVVPLTWWDHLKSEHAPTWFLKRWPAKTRTFDRLVEFKTIVTNTRLCPHTEIDKDYKHVEWLAGVEFDGAEL